MNNKKLLIKTIYRGVWLLVALVATIFTLTDHVSAWNGDGIPATLFYTSWSVWLVTIVALVSFIFSLLTLLKGKEEEKQTIIPVVKFCGNIMIIATFIVSGFVLENKLWTPGYWTAGSVFKHFLLPIITIVDCGLFDPKHSYRVSYPFIGVVSSLIYWVTVVVRAVVFRNAQGGQIPADLQKFYYPYGFTNFDNGHTVGGLSKMLAGILVGLIIIGFIFWLVDKLTKEDGKLQFNAKVDEPKMNDIFHKKEK